MSFRMLVVVSWLAAVSSAANAEDASDTTPKLPTVRVEADRLQEGYVAPNASLAKTDTLLRDLPQSVSVITRQTIDDLNVQNIGEAMQYVPGVSMAQGEGNRETPVIRGSSSTGDFFLDGMRDDVQYYRDLYNIEQVEVLKGPNGAVFGRGGVGGLINRVSKEAGWDPIRQIAAQLGTHSNRRAAVDLGRSLNDSVALRFNGLYEDSDSYREDVTLERYGVNPTLTWRAHEATKVTLGAEYFHDERIADRGVSSFEGRPLDVAPATFFGDPDQSPTHTTVKMANALVQHHFNDTAILTNRTRYGDYDKFYQNVYAGVTSIDGTEVALAAYNNATQRNNLFNQTDLNFQLHTGAIQHKLLTGIELGRQKTDNFRNTGFFDSVAFDTLSVFVPVSDPRTTLPVTFRQSALDADNDGTAKVAALYVQDEITLFSKVSALLGVRFDHFTVHFSNHRTATDIKSKDDLFSPRVGLVYKPTESVSLYSSYSKTYQPRAGDQLGSLALTNESLDPEAFENLEVGAKWDVLPTVALTAALFRLERANVAVFDPLDPTQAVLVDGQRNQGLEFGLTGRITERWNVIGTFTWQDGEIETTQSAVVEKGATLANLPRSMFSLWNRYDFSPTWGVGLGVVRKANLLAATENLAAPALNVRLPSFTRVDGAVFFKLNDRWRAQLNAENLLDEDYFLYANSNTNITPGSPRAARLVITAQL